MLAKCFKCGFMTKLPFEKKHLFRRCRRCGGTLKISYTNSGEIWLEKKQGVPVYMSLEEININKRKVMTIATGRGYVTLQEIQIFFKDERNLRKAVNGLILNGYLRDTKLLGRFEYTGKEFK